MADLENKITVDERLGHIAFIMDGNGRWAQKRMMPRTYGHKHGAENFKNIVRYCGDIGIKAVTVYAFSTENWGRPKNEVDTIMNLLSQYLDTCEEEMKIHNIRYKFLGDMSVFTPELRKKIEHVEELSKDNGLLLNVALNYGSRAEIVHAFKVLAAEGKREITEEDISGALYTAHCPDPDIIVRTGGDIRLSNFLLWQAQYSEFYFTDVLWPDLSPSDVDEIVREFYRRKRKYGKV
ncbi:MAG: di-trans,poly-cis-decaprenylcistransferase [Clostridia bacterium]|nr:di-trans,poly-cis-decaprenylcistransferase [Clostridia bacterium]